jgi:hypothetical protein
MDALNNRSITCSNTFNKNEALAKVIVEDDDLYEECRRRLRASKLRTHMGAGEALNSTIMKYMEQLVYMKYPELEQDLSRQEEESFQASSFPVLCEEKPRGLAAAIASSFQSMMARIGNENNNTNRTASLASGQGVTKADRRRGSLTMITSTLTMTARNIATASLRRRDSLAAGSILDAFFIVEDIEEEEHHARNADLTRLDLLRAISYSVSSSPPASPSPPPRQEICERLDTSHSSLMHQLSRPVTSTAPHIIGGASSMIRQASFSDVCASAEADVAILHQASATLMGQHEEVFSQKQAVLIASEVDQTTSACYFGAWDNDEDCTCRRLY